MCAYVLYFIVNMSIISGQPASPAHPAGRTVLSHFLPSLDASIDVRKKSKFTQGLLYALGRKSTHRDFRGRPNLPARRWFLLCRLKSFLTPIRSMSMFRSPARKALAVTERFKAQFLFSTGAAGGAPGVSCC